jgi:hypothetical protein
MESLQSSTEPYFSDIRAVPDNYLPIVFDKFSGAVRL